MQRALVGSAKALVLAALAARMVLDLLWLDRAARRSDAQHNSPQAPCSIMRVLLDESVPAKLRRHLPGHTVKTVTAIG